jgi:hypothetical protein
MPEDENNGAAEEVVLGACHFVDATGRLTCEDGMTAEECAERNGQFFPNQQCP